MNPDVHTAGDRNGRTYTWLKPPQIKRLRDECLTDTCPPDLQDRDEAIVRFTYDAGLRVGELVALNVYHVDLEAGTVFLPSVIQKGSPPPATLSRERDTVRTLWRYLRDRWKDTPSLFPTRSSDRMTTRSLRGFVEKLALDANIHPLQATGGTGHPEDVTTHRIRRIHATRSGRLLSCMPTATYPKKNTWIGLIRVVF